jgi:flagellar hook-associated protein 2
MSSINFSGSSTFSADFQAVIERVVSRAQIPLQTKQAQVSALNGQQSALNQLTSTLTGVQLAVDALSDAVNGPPVVTVSDGTALSGTATSTALKGTYSVQVDDIGSSTTTLSLDGLTSVSDPSISSVSSSRSFTLTVNGVGHSLTLASGTLDALVDAVNNASAGVQATIVNVSSTSTPDYRLAISSTGFGGDTIQLNDGSADLLNTLSTGTPVKYKINGSPVDIQSNSRDVTLSPGLTVSLKKTTTSPVTVTTGPSIASLNSALSGLASAYNAAFDNLTQHRGQNGGALSGQSIVYTVTNALRAIAQYAGGSGSVASLTDLGLALGSTGHLNFNPGNVTDSTVAAAKAFLGNETSSGFLKTAKDRLTSLTDASTGVLQVNVQTIQDRIKAETKLIADDQSRISTLQQNLLNQLSRADAVIAGLQSQANYFQQVFQATYGKNNNS